MQAFILTCLLCLQTQFPCDSNQLSPLPEDPSCSQCITELSNHFNITNSSDISQWFDRNLGESSKNYISQELGENLEDLFADMKDIARNMKGDPDDLYQMINKLRNDMSQILVASGPSIEGHDETLISVPGQEGSLEKILEKFSQLIDWNDVLQTKLTIMQSIVSDGEAEEKRDSIKQGERLMIGESLVSKNGQYRLNFELGTADWVLYDEEGEEVKRQINCFKKPIGSNIHVFMNHTPEFYWDIWQGKSANGACSSGIPEICAGVNSNCLMQLDNDGRLNLITSRGQVVQTYF